MNKIDNIDNRIDSIERYLGKVKLSFGVFLSGAALAGGALTQSILTNETVDGVHLYDLGWEVGYQAQNTTDSVSQILILDKSGQGDEIDISVPEGFELIGNVRLTVFGQIDDVCSSNERAKKRFVNKFEIDTESIMNGVSDLEIQSPRSVNKSYVGTMCFQYNRMAGMPEGVVVSNE